MKENSFISFSAVSGPDSDGLVRLEVAAENESFFASTQEYVSAHNLEAFAISLNGFPVAVPSEIDFHTGAGSDFIAVKVKNINALGHVAIRVSFAKEPGIFGANLESELAEFWLVAEPIAISRFARQIINLLNDGGEAELQCVGPNQRFNATARKRAAR